MNKTDIKNFAVWARRKLISEITYKAELIGINEKEISSPLPMSTDNVQFFDIGTSEPAEISDIEIRQRGALIKRIKEKESTSDYETAFRFVMEEVAYTWFNRLIAIRFMEANDYLPSRIRVLSSETKGKSEPDMVTTPFDTDMEFSLDEADKIVKLKDENKLDELFRMLFIKQCNKLNEVLPELFEKTADYTEFLLNISFTDRDGIVSHLVHDIAEEDFTEAVEIIGWMYQYYNIEPKDEVFALLKKKVKITKERIPAATQLFTPDWIVRYMVENSLGRLWVEGHPNDRLKSEWKYYLEEAEQEESVKAELEKIRLEYKKLTLEDIKVIDPCMGSGHMLVYAFDVLMQIYESQGYTQRDAAQIIVEKNLYGIDIDKRAYQLAYFAVMMKARRYDRRFLAKGITPNLAHTDYTFDIGLLQQLSSDKIYHYFKNSEDAGLVGSLVNASEVDFDNLIEYMRNYDFFEIVTLDRVSLMNDKENIIRKLYLYKFLAQKYNVVITNPPYMGTSGMNKKLADYVKKNYPDSKSDLFAVFIEKCLQMTKSNFYTAMITQHAFMFLSSYEKLRSKLLLNDFVSMAHLGARAFEEIGGEVVQTTSFVMRKSSIESCNAVFARLVNYNSQRGKENAFLAKNELYTAKKEKFSKIPGSPIAYWTSEKLLKSFQNGTKMIDLVEPKQGLATADNNRFLRLWWEPISTKIKYDIKSTEESAISGFKWVPYNKGGERRQWYGNYDYVVNWEKDGLEIRNFKDNNGKQRSAVRSPQVYFKEAITWSDITSGGFSIRYRSGGGIHDVTGMSAFSQEPLKLKYLLGLMSTKISDYIFKILNPTIHLQIGNFSDFPVLGHDQIDEKTLSIINNSIQISQNDWDSFEISWDFKAHPLIEANLPIKLHDKDKKYEIDNLVEHPKFKILYAMGDGKADTRIESAFNIWSEFAEKQFNQIKSNEEELNRIFIDIYGLQDELSPKVEDTDITIRKGDLVRDVKSLISYAVGCMLGRYSLDVEGLVYAGGSWCSGKYTTFIPDKDNCIPITGEEYFEDDIVGLFVAFVKKVYGAETLEENLDFIAKALGNKGNSSREIIRNYFIKDFYKDHVKIYQKRPIYWLYDSGKQDGFKALIYLHRYTADTTGIVRVDYLHKMQKIYMSEIDRMQDMADNSNNAREVAQAVKRKEKLIKQLKETKEYDEKIAHLALSRIEIDLDDGVKVNYEKVQTGTDGKKYEILGKYNSKIQKGGISDDH